MKLRKHKVSSEKKKIGSQKHQQPTQKNEKLFFCILEKSILKFLFLLKSYTGIPRFDCKKYTTSAEKKKFGQKKHLEPTEKFEKPLFCMLTNGL